eukprot:353138-Chlamydomonas_euryale.AAC.11
MARARGQVSAPASAACMLCCCRCSLRFPAPPAAPEPRREKLLMFCNAARRRASGARALTRWRRDSGWEGVPALPVNRPSGCCRRSAWPPSSAGAAQAPPTPRRARVHPDLARTCTCARVHRRGGRHRRDTRTHACRGAQRIGGLRAIASRRARRMRYSEQRAIQANPLRVRHACTALLPLAPTATAGADAAPPARRRTRCP